MDQPQQGFWLQRPVGLASDVAVGGPAGAFPGLAPGGGVAAFEAGTAAADGSVSAFAGSPGLGSAGAGGTASAFGGLAVMAPPDSGGTVGSGTTLAWLPAITSTLWPIASGALSFWVTLTRLPFALRTMYSKTMVSAVVCSAPDPGMPPTSEPPSAVKALTGPDAAWEPEMPPAAAPTLTLCKPMITPCATVLACCTATTVGAWLGPQPDRAASKSVAARGVLICRVLPNVSFLRAV